jgi:hypothetical protein
MFLLPKGNPLAENVPVAKLQLPEALEKLKNGSLTGCAVFDFPGADCALIYDGGNLIGALVHRENKELHDQAALQALVDLLVLANSGSFSVYGFSQEMTLALLGLINGTAVIDGQEIKEVDFKALLDRIKNERMTGTLKIYTADRSGLIFYKDGATIGFFHNAAASVETSAGEVQQIAALPGAKACLSVLRNEQTLTADLAELIDIRKLWEAASGNIFAAPTAAIPKALAPAPVSVASAGDIESAITELANQFLGKLGRALAEKELTNIGGAATFNDASKLDAFLAAMERGSKLLASANKIKEMNAAIAKEASKL